MATEPTDSLPVVGRDDERKIPGGPPGHDHYENGSVEFRVRCGKCGLRMCRVTAEVFQGGPSGPDFYDAALGRDDEDDGRAVQEPRPGHGRSLECLGGGGKMPTSESYYPTWIESFMFVCPGKRCTFRRHARRTNVQKGMRTTWNRGSYEIVAGKDF